MGYGLLGSIASRNARLHRKERARMLALGGAPWARASLRAVPPRQRRALSMPRAPGRVFADGHRASAEALVAALRAPHVDHDIADSLTHPFHTYPARLHPATARLLVELVGAGAGTSPIVDPFCGSGTTVVAALKLGRRAVGIDSDPASIQLSQRRIDALVE